jgi:hypothetical protein
MTNGPRAFGAGDVDDGQAHVRVPEGGEQRMHALERERRGRARGAGAARHAALLVVHQRREERVCEGARHEA